MRLGHRTRVGLLGAATIFVALIAIAFAVGGSGSKSSGGSSAGVAVGSLAPAPSGVPYAGHGPASYSNRMPAGNLPAAVPAPPDVATAPGAAEMSGGGSGGAATAGSSGASALKAADASVQSGSSLGASRIVKTGNLTIRVDKGSANVQNATQALTVLASKQGGYVASSNTSLDSPSPYGEVVLRVPVANFEATIAAAEKLGKHVVSLDTSAADVTGKYVDLTAKLHALQRTRSTYLTILGRATTIGATLAVQERIDEVQQQIDQLTGQIKLLGSQSSYSTLTVDVVPAGGALAPVHHHARHGIGKAWHDSWARFGRGVDALVGAIGPIVFALLLIGLLALVAVLGYRGVRRATGGPSAAA